jgi:hypothetical protein
LRPTPNESRGGQAANAARENPRGNPAQATAQQSRVQQSHVGSATFAHGASSGQNAYQGAEMRQQQQRATAAAAANTRNAEARNNESVRGNASAARSMNQPESALHSRGNVNAPQNSRSTAATTHESPQPTPAFSRTPTPSRATEQHAPNYRAEQQRVPPQNRASEQRAQQPVPSARPTYTQRAPEQHSAPAAAQQHNAPAFTQRAQEQRSAPVQRSAPQPQRAPAQAPAQAVAQHAPPQQQQQRAPAPQRQTSVARQAPQHAPKDNEKKKDGGGG